MKAECILEKLRQFVPVIDRVTARNHTLQILSYILVIATGKTIKLRATNLDIGIEVELPAKVEKEGVIAVKGSTLNELLSSLANEKTVLLEARNENLSVTTDTNKATIKCVSPNDFPTIPLITGDITFSIEAKKFLSGIHSVIYSAATNDIKPEQAGVYLYPEGDSLVFVATDSFRLAEKKVKMKLPDEFASIIIPHRNLLEAVRVLELSDGEVRVSLNKNQISFSFGGVYLTSRLIDGNFPDYKQIVPREATTEAVVLKQDLINALRISNIFTDKFNQITISALPGKKKFHVCSQSGEIGETDTEIAAALKGDDITLSVNHRYLADVFQSIASDSVSVSFTGNSRPLVIRGVSDSTFMYLVMPLNR